jgi:hypothetical protein
LPEKKTCFVVMGFGEKVDFESGRKLNLNASYQNLIKPAVENAGLECIRADEIAHSGVIDVPMYRQLLLADVVVADVSTANCNAFYELGVRHALRPYTTIIISEDKFKFPFDIGHSLIRQYKHLGEDIGVSEAKRFTGELTKAITEILAKGVPDDDSPVYTFLHGLRRLKLPDDLAPGGGAPAAAPAAAAAIPGVLDATHSALMQQIDDAQKAGAFDTAKALLVAVRALRPGDDYITQRLALVTYKNKKQPLKDRFEEARELLLTLNPETSNDTETLGLWGAVNKILWENTDPRDSSYLNQAIRGYERGFYLRNDYYNGINFAYMLNVRAQNTTDRAAAIADFIQARRVRAEVVEICDAWLQSAQPPLRAFSTGFEGGAADEKYLRSSKYWVLATKAEAYFGMEKAPEAKKLYDEAFAFAPEPWMIESTSQQRDKLAALLANSPLRFVSSE